MNLDLINKQIEAYNEQDLEKFASYYHSEIVITDVTNNTVMLTGLNELKEIYHNLFQKYPNNHAEVTERIVLDDKIIDKEVITGRGESAQDLNAIVVYQIKDSLIHRVWIF